MDIPIRHDEAGHRFVAELEGGTAELTYVARDATTVVMTHTYVPPALRGSRIASMLAARALEWAKQSGHRVVPVCSFVATYMQRHPEYEALLSR